MSYELLWLADEPGICSTEKPFHVHLNSSLIIHNSGLKSKHVLHGKNSFFIADKFSGAHRAACKTFPAMGRMDDFYIIDGRMIFYGMGSRARDPSRSLIMGNSPSWVSGLFTHCLMEGISAMDLFRQGNRGSAGGVFFLGMMNFPHLNGIFTIRCHQCRRVSY